MINCPRKVREYIKTLHIEEQKSLKKLPKKAAKEHGNFYMDAEKFDNHETFDMIKFFDKIGKKCLMKY